MIDQLELEPRHVCAALGGTENNKSENLDSNEPFYIPANQIFNSECPGITTSGLSTPSHPQLMHSQSNISPSVAHQPHVH
jgi:hypothetical protein